MNAEENRRVVESYWAAMATNDFSAASEWLHEDFVLDWPQSGERVRGRANFVVVNQNYPSAGRWTFTVHRLVADDEGVASEVEVSDGTTTGTAITFSEIWAGKIIRQVEYWPDPFPPAEWRARWVEVIV